MQCLASHATSNGETMGGRNCLQLASALLSLPFGHSEAESRAGRCEELERYINLYTCRSLNKARGRVVREGSAGRQIRQIAGPERMGETGEEGSGVAGTRQRIVAVQRLGGRRQKSSRSRFPCPPFSCPLAEETGPGRQLGLPTQTTPDHLHCIIVNAASSHSVAPFSPILFLPPPVNCLSLRWRRESPGLGFFCSTLFRGSPSDLSRYFCTA